VFIAVEPNTEGFSIPYKEIENVKRLTVKLRNPDSDEVLRNSKPPLTSTGPFGALPPSAYQYPNLSNFSQSSHGFYPFKSMQSSSSPSFLKDFRRPYESRIKHHGRGRRCKQQAKERKIHSVIDLLLEVKRL